MIIKFPKTPSLFSSKIPSIFTYSRQISWTLLSLLPICYFFIDKPVALYFEHISTATSEIFTFFTHLIAPSYYFFVLPPMYFIVRFIRKKKKAGDRVLFLLGAVSMSNMIVELLKLFFARPRPEEFFEQHIYRIGFFHAHQGSYSFPSGHACTAAAVMTCFSYFFPKYSIPLFIFGAFLACSRIVLTVHFVSDVLGGLLVGFILTQYMHKILKEEHLHL